MSLCIKNKDGEIVKVAGSGGISTANQIAYDNTISEVEATNVQEAIDGILEDMTDSIKTHPCIYGGNYDDFVESGRYENLGNSSQVTMNAPDGKNADNNFYVDVFKRDDLYIKQIAYSVRVPYENYSRVKTDGVWRNWEKLPDKYDINTKVNTDRKIADITLENDITAINLSEKIIPTFETREEFEAYEAENGEFPVGTKVVITSEEGEGGASSADNVSYDNSKSELEATNVQDAIDEIKNEFSGASDDFLNAPFNAMPSGYVINNGKTYMRYSVSFPKTELKKSMGAIYIQSVDPLSTDMIANIANATPLNYESLGLKIVSSTSQASSVNATVLFKNPNENINYKYVYIKPFVIGLDDRVRYLPIIGGESRITLYDTQQSIGDINSVLEAIL